MRLPKDFKEAKEIQLRLKRKIRIVPLEKRPQFIAGVDASFQDDNIIAAACL
ncbi:MAG: hypothetical protein HZA16_15405 [Nitrospirae bacterium]|nr:hypothetical protein [Nitrospirota bacterium]